MAFVFFFFLFSFIFIIILYYTKISLIFFIAFFIQHTESSTKCSTVGLLIFTLGNSGRISAHLGFNPSFLIHCVTRRYVLSSAVIVLVFAGVDISEINCTHGLRFHSKFITNLVFLLFVHILQEVCAFCDPT